MKQIKTICCVCQEIIRDGETINGMVSHGYCQTHYQEMMDKIDKYYRKKQTA